MNRYVIRFTITVLVLLSAALSVSCQQGSTSEQTGTITTAPTTTTPSITNSTPPTKATITTTTTTAPSGSTTLTSDFIGEWNGIIEGYWADTFYYPEDIIGGGVNQLTYNYSIILSLDVSDNGTFTGTAQFTLEQPLLTYEVTEISDNGNVITLLEYRAEISPTEFTAPVTGNFAEAGVLNLYFDDIPDRHQTYFYATVDSFGNHDTWQHSFDTEAIPVWSKQFSYNILGENTVSVAYQASDEDTSGSIPNSSVEEATGTLNRAG